MSLNNLWKLLGFQFYSPRNYNSFHVVVSRSQAEVLKKYNFPQTNSKLFYVGDRLVTFAEYKSEVEAGGLGAKPFAAPTVLEVAQEIERTINCTVTDNVVDEIHYLMAVRGSWPLLVANDSNLMYAIIKLWKVVQDDNN